MRKLILIMLIVSAHHVVFAQEVLNAVDQKQNFKQRKAVPYASTREADVVYAKKITRVIDTREKKNLVMKWPKNAFAEVLKKYIKQGEASSSGRLRVYPSDSFNKPLTIARINKIGEVCVETTKEGTPENPYGGGDTTICTDYDFSQITRFEINEVWIFDKQRGSFFPRIVSIAPLYIPVINGSIALNEQPMFYIRYDDLRQLLVSEPVFNRQNDATPLSYYDFFEQRMFSSYITKESNPQDLAIRDMPDFKDKPMEALYESERIKKSLSDWESDLWEQ